MRCSFFLWTLGLVFGGFTLWPSKLRGHGTSWSKVWTLGLTLHTMLGLRLQFLYFIGYFQPISLNSQQSLVIQSHGLLTWTAIVWSGPYYLTYIVPTSFNNFSHAFLSNMASYNEFTIFEKFTWCYTWRWDNFRWAAFHAQDLGPLHTRDWEPMTTTLQTLSLVEKVEPVQVRCTLCLRDKQSMWMQVGCKVYINFYLASNGSCYMVTWIIFKNHFLEVGLTQNRETMTLLTFTTVDLFYFIMRADMRE